MDILGEQLNVAYVENKDAMKMKLDPRLGKVMFLQSLLR